MVQSIVVTECLAYKLILLEDIWGRGLITTVLFWSFISVKKMVLKQSERGKFL